MIPTATRVRTFDWLRGIAVLVMIQTHALALLKPELRAGAFYSTVQWIDGLVAPSFIFAAGFALALTQVRAALASDSPEARKSRFLRTLRRIFEVLFVATFMNWMWFPIFREPRWILRIDILQCIGISLLIALPLLFLLAPHPRALRGSSLLLAALVFAAAPLGEHIPLPLGHLLNTASGSVFPLLPWSGYVYLGAAIGATAAVEGARGTAKWLAALVGVGLIIWYCTPWFTSIYPAHEFWVTNPANCARRWTQVCLFALLLLALEQLWPKANSRAIRFIEIFGTSSLAGYFLHETLLYFHIFGYSFYVIWGEHQTWLRYSALLVLLIACTFMLTWVVDQIYRRVDQRLAPRRRAAQAIGPIRRASQDR